MCVYSKKPSLQIVLWKPPGDFVRDLMCTHTDSTRPSASTSTASSSELTERDRCDSEDVMTDDHLTAAAVDDDDMDL